MHGALYGRVGCFGIHHIKQNVYDFIASGTKDRRTENLFGIGIDSDFDGALSFSLFNGPADSLHGILRNQRAASGLSDMSLCHPAAPQRRIDEESIGLDSLRHTTMVAVREIVRNDLVVVVRCMRKCPPAITVAKRPNPWDIRTQLIIHDDVASFVGDDTGLIQRQIVCVGNTSDGEQEMAAPYFRCPLVTAYASDDFIPMPFDRHAVRIQPDAHTFRL